MEIDGFGKSVPPVKEHVIVYFIQKGFSEKEALSFFNFYNNRGWASKHNRLIKDWKRTAWQWIMKALLD